MPVRFGLTQTYGVFASPDRARAVYDRAAQRLPRARALPEG